MLRHGGRELAEGLAHEAAHARLPDAEDLGHPALREAVAELEEQRQPLLGGAGVPRGVEGRVHPVAGLLVECRFGWVRARGGTARALGDVLLVRNDEVIFVAGRSNFLDGGLRFYRLDAESGKVLAQSSIDEKDPETGKNVQSKLQVLNMTAGLPDILSADDKWIYMRSQRFDLAGRQQVLGPVSGSPAEQGAARSPPARATWGTRPSILVIADRPCPHRRAETVGSAQDTAVGVTAAATRPSQATPASTWVSERLWTQGM